MTEIKKVAFAGSGNVTTHLSEAFYQSNIEIIGFYSRNLHTAELLAKKYKTKYGKLERIKSL